VTPSADFACVLGKGFPQFLLCLFLCVSSATAHTPPYYHNQIFGRSSVASVVCRRPKTYLPRQGMPTRDGADSIIQQTTLGYVMPSYSATGLSILHVVDSLETGGLERMVTDLAINQHRSGLRIAVFSLLATTGLTSVLEGEGIAVIQGNKSSSLDWVMLQRLRQTITSRTVDVVHSHGYVPSYYAALAVFGIGKRHALVNTCHDMAARLSGSRLRMLYRWSVGRSQYVVAVGQSVLTALDQYNVLGVTPRRVVRNGVRLAQSAPTELVRSEARDLLELPLDALIVGAVGRLVAVKNHHSLVRSFAELLPQFPRLYLVIVGDGQLLGEIESLASTLGVRERLKMLGLRNDVDKILPAFDVYAQPSHSEGLSIAVLEAMAHGLPVVATAVGGNSEIVQDGVTGVLVRPSEQDSLTEAIKRLLVCEQLRHTLGKAARAWVINNASVEAMESAYSDLYLFVAMRH
jgi:glycosyltransferase involved in cell wall biosynthesis